MKKLTPLQIQRTNKHARQDLEKYHQLLKCIGEKKIIQTDVDILMGAWPPPEEVLKSGTYLYYWKTKIEEEIERINKLLEGNEKWLGLMKGRAFRCALPKKKQRELGLLPPV